MRGRTGTATNRKGRSARPRLLAIAAVATMCATTALAHGDYSEWKRPDTGTSCCNDQDCRPVELCDHGRGLDLGGKCTPIPWDKVINKPSPDGRTHVCWLNFPDGTLTVLCVVLEGAV